MNKRTTVLYIIIMILIFGLSSAFGQKTTTIHVTTDDYPDETYWILMKDSLYGDTIAEVAAGHYLLPNQTYTDTVLLNDTITDITFLMRDTYGDGITSPGSFYVAVCNDTIISIPTPNFATGMYWDRVVPSCFSNPPPPPPGPCVPITLIINLDQYPGETSWEIKDTLGNILFSHGFYTNTPNYEPQVIPLCIPTGDFILTINDAFGDGLAGGLWGGQDGSYYLTQCNDTLVASGDPNFGESIDHAFVSDTCAPVPPVLGCMDWNYLEYNPLAAIDDGSCLTPVVFGCIDSTAFNYVDSANTNNYINDCDYTLKLTDLGANGWAGSFIEVKQGATIIDTFTLLSGSDTSFVFNLGAPEAVQVKFHTTYNSGLTSNQCGFSLISPTGDTTLYFPGGFQLQQQMPPFIWVTGITDCGNDCIPKVYGCTDTLAVNYNNLANTEDSTCYYLPGCTSPAYLEYYTQGFVADYDNGSCDSLAVWGCMDTTAFNYDSTANIDNGGCIPVVLGCMNPFAFNYNALANTADTCLPFIYGCTDPTMFNYDSLANTSDNSCIPVVFGCIDSLAINYSLLANTDNGSCVYPIYGCTDPIAINYNVDANMPDSSCYYSAGCNVGDIYYIPNACFEWVISIDDYCCDVSWDSTCVDLYEYCDNSWTGPVSVNDITQNRNINVYPNPVLSKIYINKNVDLIVFSMLGDMIISKQNINTLDVSKMNPGVYILHIIYNDKSYIKKIVKK